MYISDVLLFLSLSSPVGTLMPRHESLDSGYRRMNHVAHVNMSCRTHIWRRVVSHIWMSHDTHVWCASIIPSAMAVGICKGIISHVCVFRVAHIKEYERVVWHIWMSYDTYVRCAGTIPSAMAVGMGEAARLCNENREVCVHLWM